MIKGEKNDMDMAEDMGVINQIKKRQKKKTPEKQQKTQKWTNVNERSYN